MKTTLPQALQLIDRYICPQKEDETVLLMKSRGRVSAKNIQANFCIPPYDMALCDGYAVSKKQIKQAALCVEDLVFVSTGERVQKDSFCIIEQERIEGKTIDIELLCKQKTFIKPKGEDIRKKDILVKKGNKIGSFDIANLATQGVSKVRVIKEARFAYLGIGDELIDVQEKIGDSKIYNSNAYTMASRGEMSGVRTATIENVKDDVDAVKKRIKKFKKHDVIITIGGMSKGDTMYTLLKEGWLKIVFMGVKMSPAGLTAFSFYKKTPILHLPGLPMSALLGFEILGSAIIRKIYAHSAQDTKCMSVCLKHDIKNLYRSQRIVPGFFDGNSFAPMKILAGMSNVLNNCNGYILPKQKVDLKRGQRVDFYPFKSWQ